MSDSTRAEKNSVVVWQWIGSRRWQLVGLAIYVLIALWLTWPLVLSPLSQIPIGSESAATVPLSSVWIIWWNADRLAGLMSNYWDAPIFFPTSNTFALNEPQPTTLLVAPVIWITGSRILAYNVYLWASLVLNGVFAQRLLKLYGMDTFIAIWGGMAMVLLPIVNWQLGVIQLIPLWGILWTWTAIEQLCRQPTRLRGVELGLAVGISIVTSVHHGLFLAILLVAAAPTLWRQLLTFRDWPVWPLAVLVALIIAGPFAYQIHKAVKQHGSKWERDWVMEQSAQPGDYLQAYGGQLIEFTPQKISWRMLSPGWIKIGLAVMGVIVGLRQVASRRWSSFLLVIAILAFLLSLGPNLRLWNWQPWWSLAEHVPGFAQVRNVFRFAFFVHMAVVIFAAMGLYGLHQACCHRLKRRNSQLAMRSVLVVLALTALLEVRPQSGRFATVPDAGQHRVWLDYVRTQTPADHAIACFPFAPGYRAADYQVTTEWMYLGSFHGIPLVNGYSTHFPEHYMRLRHEIVKGFPTPAILAHLDDQKVKFLVLRRPPEQKGTMPKVIPVGGYRLDLVCEDQWVDVYQLGRATQGTPGVPAGAGQ